MTSLFRPEKIFKSYQSWHAIGGGPSFVHVKLRNSSHQQKLGLGEMDVVMVEPYRHWTKPYWRGAILRQNGDCIFIHIGSSGYMGKAPQINNYH